jgi:hypothetical protein
MKKAEIAGPRRMLLRKNTQQSSEKCGEIRSPNSGSERKQLNRWLAQ